MKDKIPFYNIVNMFFVGSIFTLIIVLLFHSTFKSINLSAPIFSFLKDWSIVVTTVVLMVMYEIGFILNRTSSIIINPILVKLKMWPKEEYDIDISKISDSHPKFQTLITELVLMRTHILIYMLVAIISLFSPYKYMSIVFLIIAVLFALGGIPHNSKINKMRKSFAEEQKNRDKEESLMKGIENYYGKLTEKAR